MDPEPYDVELQVRTRNRWIVGLSLATPLVALVSVVIGVMGGPSFESAPVLAFLALLGALTLLRRNPSPVLAQTRVRIEPEVLHVGDRAIARSSIRDAQLVPLKAGPLVVRIARTKKLPIDLVVPNKVEGRRLLHALGFDASQTTTQFRGGSLPLRFLGANAGVAFFVAVPILLVILSGLLESSPTLFALGTEALFVLAVAGILAAAIPSHLDVGADGVFVRWLGMKQFHPLSRFREVARYVDGFGNMRQVGVAVTMEGGRVVRLPMGSLQWNDDRNSALMERIVEAMEIHARGNVDAAAALLGRRARDVRAWIQELRAIGAGANADLRTAPVNPEHLWRIVESHGAEPEDRAAAAVALGGQLDGAGSNGSGSPWMRSPTSSSGSRSTRP